MATGLNRVSLVGNVGKDPEIRSLPGGKEVASFTMATSESWRDKSSGELKSKSEWHSISVFNEHLIGLIKRSVAKGTRLYVEGSLTYRKWQDKNGSNHVTAEIALQSFGSTIVLLDRKSGEDGTPKEDDSSQASSGKYEYKHESDLIAEDEIPF